MSYQVLARKYRPQCFEQMVGHTGTRRALINALKNKKLHHAYLLTGTRGIGKTSLARLLAKCLNCEKDVTSTPCESCENCIAIRKGQFVDLIEVDAASRTRVEDTQNLLENVQYKPILGRYKIYIIDEVHMLSMHSFNALLKTLEEPPAHIIFFLATTDLQRVPDTIISRCLHFPLKQLGDKEIIKQLEDILTKEGIKYEKIMLEKIAKLAKGSARDALSLLEPVILHGENNQVTLKDFQAIFGYIDISDQWSLIKAIHSGDMIAMKKLLQAISIQSIDFEKLLDEIIEAFYQIAFTQQSTFSSSHDKVPLEIIEFAKNILPEQVQLYYQIALTGKKELHLAPTPQLGFEMTLLRMMAFKPLRKEAVMHTDNKPAVLTNTLDWTKVVAQLPVTGFLKSFVLHCSLESYSDKELVLLLDSKYKALYSKEREALLQKILHQHFKKDIKLCIQIGSTTQLTPADLAVEKAQQHKEAAYQSVLKDDNIQAIQKEFDATIQTEAIQLNYES